ncbi:ornithine cyclodeaminase family protein [Kitasatospora sp. NPDC056138]|uniref:ornithine cyclodeaminase family protein n=1 Tax=Kitasatospora sp. NPDC056138 TaxID=3345724 RepID=UPI0035E169E4
MLRIIDGDTVRSLYSGRDALPAMERALTAFSAGSAYQHPRITVEPPGEGGMVLLMPAAAEDRLGLKLLSMFPRAGERGLPNVQGLVILVDAVHGEPLAIIDGISVTEIRTAAVTALATGKLARPDATGLALIGAGVQARGHLQALADVRPWKSVRLYSRTPERAHELARWARGEDIPVEIADSATAALAGADVICTVTSSYEPVLADSDVAAEGVHINAVGAFGPTCRELPSELVGRARIFVDSRQAALAEAGDLIVPLRDGVITEDAIVAEIGDVLAGADGRLGDELTLFESLGLPIQDVVACAEIYRRAVERDAGHVVRFP